MKEQIEFKVFNEDSLQLNTVVELHRSVHLDTFFNNKLIYFDDNFKNYLIKLVKDENHFFYVVEVNSSIIGFAHFRLIDDFLFLNTISINKEYAGIGLGKKLLSYCIQAVLKKNKKINTFKLDVFESNFRALNWYKKLEFEEEKKTDWYLFNNVNPVDVLDFKRIPDNNGFLSLFDNSSKIATLVNNHLLLHNSNYIFDIDIKQYQSVQTNDNSFKTNRLFNKKTIDYKLIDVTIRMRINLENIIEKYENA